MVFNIPSSQKDVVDRASTDVQNALPESNPFFKNSFLGAIITSFAGRIFDFYLQLNILIRELFVDTATNTFLERWGVYRNITRNAATKSTGNITATGTTSSSIPISTQLQDAAGLQFTTTGTVAISNIVISVTSLTRSGSTVTAVTTSAHEYGSTQTPVIAGAAETEYNGIQTITVVDNTTFTYEITTTPATPATGTITSADDMASLTVESTAFGKSNNLVSGTQLTFSSPIAGVDNTAIVQFGEVAGGTDLESDEDLRIRVINIYQNPIAHFSEDDIINQAKKVAGVTRVFVFASGEDFGNSISIASINRNGNVATVVTDVPHNLEQCMFATMSGADQTEYNITARVLVIDDTTFTYIVQGTPATPASGTILMQGSIALGQVIIFFTRDNDANVIPSASEVNTTKDKLIEIMPANTSVNDMIVNAPTANIVNFTFTDLTPNTSTMQAAITANLEQLFEEGTSVGQDLKSFSYESAIFQTVDSETGDIITDFTLSAPSGDVSIAADELPILGSIAYP